MIQDQITQPSMYCRKCGYALHGLSENRCPECGRPFDPTKPRTYRRHLPSWPRRHWVATTLILLSLLVGAILFTPLGLPLAIYLSVASDMRHVHDVEAQMQLPANYQPVAKDLALYCQSLPIMDPLPRDPWYMWLPPSASKFGPHHVDITPNRAHIELGGGFYHYGYILEKDATASTSESNTWVLELLSEGLGSITLTRFTIPPGQQLTRDQFIANAVANYDREIASPVNPKPGEVYQEWHQRKVAFLLHYGMASEARSACRQMLNKEPDSWWANLTVALIDARQDPQGAQTRLKQWVQASPSCSRDLCLAHYYRFENRPSDAATAASRAITFGIRDDSLDQEGETADRVYDMALYLYDSNEFAAVICLCDALAPTLGGENQDLKNSVATLKSAAISAQGGIVKAPAPNQPDDPYHLSNGDVTIDLEELRGGDSP